MDMSDKSISVIIPTLNEEENIAKILEYLLHLDSRLELIVADGGSSDQTVARARQFAALVHSPRGRGAQMNAGAQKATGDVLWFIHADCRPHPQSIKAMLKALQDDAVVGGAFQYVLDQPGLYLRIAETLSNLKNRLLKLIFGDMGIFVHKKVFKLMNGYAEIPLMEDMDFCKRLKQLGKIVILPQKINTSARRWIEEGYIRNSLRSWILQSAWAVGASSHTLAKWYKFK